MGSGENQLTPTVLLSAYREAWFPMANPLTGDVEWFSPDPRAIFPLESFHVPRTLAREVRRNRFGITSDTAFGDVVRACASPRTADDLSWIDDRMVAAYVQLHRIGHAHSIEAWRVGSLVGGLYGVHIGGGFFGESMFSLPAMAGTNASKVCLVHLVHWLRRRGFVLLDTQFRTEHLDQFGCVEVSRGRYLELLAEAIARDVSWGEFEPCGGGA